MVDRTEAEIGQFYKLVNSDEDPSYTGRLLGFLKEKKEGRLLFNSGISIPIEGPIIEFMKNSAGLSIPEFDKPKLLKQTAEEVGFVVPIAPREYTSEESAPFIINRYETDDIDSYIQTPQIITIGIGTAGSKDLLNFMNLIGNIRGLSPEKTLDTVIPTLVRETLRRGGIPDNVVKARGPSEINNWLVQFDSGLTSRDTNLYQGFNYEEEIDHIDIDYYKNIPQLYATEYQGLLGKRRLLESGLVTFIPRSFPDVPHSYYKFTEGSTPEQIGKTYYDGLCEGCVLPEKFPLLRMIPFIKAILAKKGYLFVIHEAWERLVNQKFGVYCTNMNFETMCEIPTFFRTKFTEEEQLRMYRIDNGSIYPLFHRPFRFLNNSKSKPSVVYKSGPDPYIYSKFIRLPEEIGRIGGGHRSCQRPKKHRKGTQKRRRNRR